MSDFSVWYKKHGTRNKEAPDEQIDAMAEQHLKAGTLAKQLRETIDLTGGGTDEELNAKFGRMLQRKSDARERDEAALRERAASNLEKNQQTMGMAAAGPVLPDGTPLIQDQNAAAKARRALEQGSHPGEEARIPTVDTYEKLKAQQAKTGGNLVPVSGTLQLQQEGMPTHQLYGGAKFPMAELDGAPLSDKLMAGIRGGIDVVDKGVAGVASSVYDPRSGEWFPRDESGTPVPTPMKYRADVGTREYLQALGERHGESAPRLVNAQSKAHAALGAGWDAIGMARARLHLADDQRPERREYLQALGDRNGESVLRSVDAQDRAALDEAKANLGSSSQRWNARAPSTPAEANAMAARNMRDVADVYDAVTPLSALNLGISAVGKGAKALIRTRPVGDAAEAIAAYGSKGVGPGMLSDVPAGVGGPVESQALIKAAAAKSREAPNAAFNEFMDKFQGRFTPEADMAARNAWHSPEARMAAMKVPGAAQLLDEMQLENFAMHQRAGLPAKDYNPNHLYYGQNFSKAHNEAETALANLDGKRAALRDKLLRDAGIDPAAANAGAGQSANPVRVDLNTQVPGYRALAADPAIAQKLTLSMPGEQDIFLPGAREGRSAQRIIAGDVSAELMARDNNPIEAAFRRAGGKEMDNSDISAFIKERGATGLTGGHARSVREMSAASGERRREGARMLFTDDAFKQAAADYPVATPAGRPMSGMKLDEFLKDHGTSPDMFPARLTVAGDKHLDKLVFPPHIQDALTEADMVVVYPANLTAEEMADPKLLATNFITPTRYAQRKRVIALPGTDAKEPFLYPRRYAEAYAQIMHGPKEGALDDLAHVLNYAIGAKQANQSVTVYNPGFAPRNNMENITRVFVDQPGSMLPKNLKETVAWLKKPENRRAAETYLGAGKNAESRGAEFATKTRAPGMLPSGARRAVDKVFEGTQGMGKKYNEVWDHGFKERLFPGAPLGYSFDDVLRAHHYRTQVAKGVSPNVAAMTTNELLINYSDVSSAEKLAKTFFPFTKFYTGVMQGALASAARQPYRFSRLYTLANYLQNQDTASHGDRAINAKALSLRDVVTGVPMMGWGKNDSDALALRLETPLTSAMAIIDPALSTIDPSWSGKDRPATSLLGPAITQPLAMVAPDTVERVTGYPVTSMPRDLWKKYDGTGWGRLYDIHHDLQQPNIASDVAEFHPAEQTYWDAARNAPLVGGALPKWWDTPARMYTGAQSQTGRTPEHRETALIRALLGKTGLARAESVDVMRSMSQKSKVLQDAVTDPFVKTETKKKRSY